MVQLILPHNVFQYFVLSLTMLLSLQSQYCPSLKLSLIRLSGRWRLRLANDKASDFCSHHGFLLIWPACYGWSSSSFGTWSV